MGTMGQFKDAMGHVLHSIEDGWHELSRRASHALTYFKPAHEDDAPAEASAGSSRWGLLAADVHDEPERLVVRIEAPGMDVDDFDISAVDRRLTIRGEKRSERSDTRGGYHIRERAYGCFRRDLPLPAEVSDENAKATYKRGVLEIELLKKSVGKERRVKVRAA